MDYLSTDDTIVAVASATGPAARGVIRMSGQRVVDITQNIFTPHDPEVALKRFSTPARIVGSVELSGAALPATLLLWPTQKSYTRQPSAELHCVGVPPLLNLTLQKICDNGARMAQPGEFTLRAFLSGRMDLTQAEAVLAVIDSDSRSQLDTALEQLSGGLAGPLAQARQELISVLAELEAGLDFVEEDIEFISAQQLNSQLKETLETVQAVTAQIDSRGQSADTMRVALIGLPNAGKSSLLNALSGMQQAIVTDIPGTTTDRISFTTTIDGISIELSDTAGIEPISKNESAASSASIMTEALQRQSESIANSDLVILCVSQDPLSSTDRGLLEKQIEHLQEQEKTTLVIRTKADLKRPDLKTSDLKTSDLKTKSTNDHTGVPIELLRQLSVHRIIDVSSVTGTGLQRLKFEIARVANDRATGEQAVVSSTLVRTRSSLHRTEAAIAGACEAALLDAGEEVVAAEIRQALDELGQIVGTVYTDDILDLVFGRFCIGK